MLTVRVGHMGIVLLSAEPRPAMSYNLDITGVGLWGTKLHLTFFFELKFPSRKVSICILNRQN